MATYIDEKLCKAYETTCITVTYVVVGRLGGCDDLLGQRRND